MKVTVGFCFILPANYWDKFVAKSKQPAKVGNMFSPFRQMKPIVVLLLSGALLCFSRSCDAQGISVPPELTRPVRHPANKKMRTIAVKNVSADIMAFWLDPANNGMPELFQPIGPLIEEDPLVLIGHAKISLPQGIDSVLAVERQNAILVFGTSEGIAWVEKLVAELDKPIRYVYFMSQFVQMSPEDAVALGFVWSIPTEPSNSVFPESRYLNVTRPEIQTRLDELVKLGKANIISTSHAIEMNYMPVSIGVAKAIPATGGKQNKNGKSEPLPKDDPFSIVLHPEMFEVMSQFQVSPTVNNDDTISMVIQPFSTLALPKGNNDLTNAMSFKMVGGSAVIKNIKDGQTVFMSGFVSRFFPGLRDKKADSNVVVVLITAHIIRSLEVQLNNSITIDLGKVSFYK